MMFEPLRKYAEFEGRARRQEFWLFTLFQVLLSLGLFTLLMIVAAANHGDGAAQNLAAGLLISLFLLVALGLLIPSLAVSIRRLHDSDKSGLWLLLHFAPFGGFVLLIFMLLDGTPGPNRFGADPKGRQSQSGPNVVHHHHHYAAGTPAEQTPTT